MSKQHERSRRVSHGWTWAACLCLLAMASAASGQQPTPSSPAQAPPPSQPPSTDKPETKITPGQAKQLFSLVDELIKFSSDETGLPIKSTVKRKITSRDEVEGYLKEKFNE